MGLLLLRRERFFVRAEPAADGGSVLTTALLTRGSGDAAPRAALLTDELRTALDGAAAVTAPPAPRPESTPRDT
jgi:cytochrome c biogenesis protein